MNEIKKIFRDIPIKNLIYILGAIGVFLMLIPSSNNENTVIKEEEKVDYCKMLEERLEEILPEIASVGDVKVMITTKNYGEIKLARDKNGNGEETVILSQKGGGQEAKIVEQLYPDISGVIVVAEGGGSMAVKEELTGALTALLGVDAHKVKIFEKEKHK